MSISILGVIFYYSSQVFFPHRVEYKIFSLEKESTVVFMWKFISLTDSHTLFYCFSTVNNIIFPQQHFQQEKTHKQSVPPKEFIVIYLLFFQPTGLLHWVPQRKFWKKINCVTLTSSVTCQKHIKKNIFNDPARGKEKTKKPSSHCTYKFFTGRRTLQVFFPPS